VQSQETRIGKRNGSRNIRRGKGHSTGRFVSWWGKKNFLNHCCKNSQPHASSGKERRVCVPSRGCREGLKRRKKNLNFSSWGGAPRPFVCPGKKGERKKGGERTGRPSDSLLLPGGGEARLRRGRGGGAAILCAGGGKGKKEDSMAPAKKKKRGLHYLHPADLANGVPRYQVGRGRCLSPREKKGECFFTPPIEKKTFCRYDVEKN